MARRRINWLISKAYEKMTEASCKGWPKTQQYYARQWRQLIAERDQQTAQGRSKSISKFA